MATTWDGYTPQLSRELTHSSDHILGVRVDSVQLDDVVRQVQRWINEKNGTHVITVNTVNALVFAARDAEFRAVLNASDLSLPDGMPLVWLSRLHGRSYTRRVCGPELMPKLCADTARSQYRHFFYGGMPGVPETLAGRLEKLFPGMVTAGTYSPSFKPLTSSEDKEIVDTINHAAPDVLWVGLGCPKQERWMEEHRLRIRVPVMIGVGQAFDIYAGRLRRAPRWMCDSGLEWLFRLCQEPRRLWRRYLLFNTEFVLRVFCQELGLPFFEPTRILPGN